MCCIVGGAAILGPRFAVLIWWIFGNKVELAYLIAWQPGGLNGNLDALLIVIGVALDILTYMHRFAAKAVRTSPPPPSRY